MRRLPPGPRRAPQPGSPHQRKSARSLAPQPKSKLRNGQYWRKVREEEEDGRTGEAVGDSRALGSGGLPQDAVHASDRLSRRSTSTRVLRARLQSHRIKRLVSVL